MKPDYLDLLQDVIRNGRHHLSRISGTYEKFGVQVSFPAGEMFKRPGMSRQLGWMEVLQSVGGFFDAQDMYGSLAVYNAIERKNPKNQNRPYYAYTPQANFNKAYKYIEENYTNQDIVISSHPHFNKIFLQKPGYWLKYKYNGVKYPLISNDKEYYVNADVIDDLSELKNITKNKHGYIVFDW